MLFIMSSFHLVFTLVLLFTLQNVRSATQGGGESLNAVITDNAAEDMSEDETTEPEMLTTVRPTPSVRMPASSDLKKEWLNTKPEVFSHKRPYYNGQVELWPPRLADNAEVDVLEARAYCYETEIQLFLKFNKEFHGYIYPYHYFKRCHLFTGSGDTEVNLVSDKNSCGMDVTYSTSKTNISFMEFTVMIQWDPEFLGQYDRKLRVTCNRPENDRRPVTFNASNPIIRMEIEADSEDESELSPAVSSSVSSYDSVRLSETVEVSFIVDAHSTGEKFDAQIIKCFAHDGLQDEERKISTYSTQNNGGTFSYDGSKVLMADGCPIAPAYFSAFVKKAKGTSVILDSEFKVFRFPSSPFIFLSCDIRICRNECPPQQDCDSKLKTEPATSSEDQKVVTLFRPLLVKLGPAGGSPMGESDDVKRSKGSHGIPTTSFIAGLIGMGFICGIILVFMYRRFKRGTEKDYEMQYSPNADRNKDEVAPLKVTTGASATD